MKRRRVIAPNAVNICVERVQKQKQHGLFTDSEVNLKGALLGKHHRTTRKLKKKKLFLTLGPIVNLKYLNRRFVGEVSFSFREYSNGEYNLLLLHSTCNNVD